MTTPAPTAAPAKLSMKDYETVNKPDWCPGCGDFGILNSLKKALVELGKEPHQVTVIAGIGCSSKLPHWLNAYGFHTLHGRAGHSRPKAAIRGQPPRRPFTTARRLIRLG